VNSLLENLTEPQRAAVTHRDGPLLILAGPGSGKTRVVTQRIAYLLGQGVAASQVLALTFTNKAAAEMRARVEQLVEGRQVWLSTFHRFGARILRDYSDYVGLSPNFTIYDSSDAKQTLRRVIEAENVKVMHYTPERIAAAISSAKNRLVTPAEYQPRPGRPLSQIVGEVYPLYQKRLLASSAVDFDDLLLHVAQLLYKHPEIRADLDSRYRYILVDEYQDTNRAQYVILRAMSKDYPNLAVTGDPDQSIYRWRGADIKNILEFEADYPAVHVVRLEQNYRSTKRILRVADELISHNVQRKQKALHTENDEGEPVRLTVYPDQDSEAAGIALEIQSAINKQGCSPSDFAIFYRMNALSRSLEKALREAGVPFQMVRGQEFYQRKEIKDVLAYCQLVNNPLDDIAFERTVNTPARGIGKKTLQRLGEYAYRLGLPLLEAARQAAQMESLPKRAAVQLARFVEIVDRISAVAHRDVEEVVGTVLEESGYRKSLAESESEEDQNRLANIEELLTDARQFDEQEHDSDIEGGQLEAYLERTWLVNDIDDWESNTEKVTLMTLHAAKGLEFPVVFMIALEQGVLPHERSSSDPDQLEEERRLTFVGITRAEHQLQLSYAVRRDYRGQRRLTIPSPFLLEMPRGEMEQVQLATKSFPESIEEDSTEEFGDDFFETEIDQRHPSELESEALAAEVNAKPPAQKPVANSSITTAAALAVGQEQPLESGLAEPAVSPDLLTQGMAVVHPDHGLGKIVALSGAGKNRRATVRFVTAGQKRFVIAHSPLRLASK
jgi:DNA helicase-2/ATP-dependent DNA helicase PcrA